MFQPTHYVPDYLVLGLGDNESFRKCVESIYEEVRRVVFRQAYAVYVHDRVEIADSEPAEYIASLNQQLYYSENSCNQQVFDII